MAADYKKFKTPFYEIEVGDPSWKRVVKLPHHIVRLVDKVEIIENMMVDDHDQPSQMTIHFIEGSREPASPDYKLGTSGLYQIPIEGDKLDNDISGSLTNRSGIITDLRFSGNTGITFLTEEEKKSGKVDNSIQKDVEGKNTTRKYKSEAKAPVFLFQQRNKIKVTWGYLESIEDKRSMMLSIVSIASNFPETGMPTTTITCSSSLEMFDQVAGKNGKAFAKRTVLNKNGDSLIVFEDLKTDDVIRDICSKSGMSCIVSKNLLNDTIDKDKHKILLGGQSFKQFLKRLANASGCYYELLPDPVTGKETIMFISKKDFEGRTIFKDRELLNWKGPGSIIKSVDVAADFTALIGNAKKGLDDQGNPQSEDVNVSERLLNTYKSEETGKKQQLVDADPVNSANPNPAVKGFQENILNGESTGIVENTPNKSLKTYRDSAETDADAKNRLVSLNFTTVGHTKLMPGVMEVTGIGVRYSGKYRVINVTHTIDSNGYSTVCHGVSSFLGAGGVKVPDLSQGQDIDPLVEQKLFENPLNDYKKFKSK